MFATVNTAAQPKKKSSDNLPEKESTIEKNGKDDKKEVSAKDDKKLDFEFGKTNIVEEKKSDVEDKKGEEKNTEGKKVKKKKVKLHLMRPGCNNNSPS
ncbi:MAG: hypothetical protein IPJ43_02560 [Saprospiraceae bacterium]|nr:hypothetical protein [Saprospiraceae bacterium]